MDKKGILILLAITILIGLYLYNNYEHKTVENTFYYTGNIYSANHAANMIDYLATNDNIVLSPINVNTSLAILYNGTDNNSNKELKKYFKKSPSAINEEINTKLETIKENEPIKNQYDNLYDTYIKDLYNKEYNKLTLETIALLSNEEKQNLVLLSKQIELTYDRIVEKNTLTEKQIKNYVLTKNDLSFNNYTIKEQLENIISNYELYSIQNSVNNKTKISLKSSTETSINEEFTAETSFYNYELEEILLENDSINVASQRSTTLVENKEVVINNNLEFTYSWENAFNHNNVKDAEFFNLDNEVHAVEMMYSLENTYLENNRARGFKYDFKNGKYSYIGILPKQNGNFKLSELNIDSLILSKQEAKTLIGMPKMDYNSEIDIKELASYYNIREIFTKEANFTKITDDSLQINEMIQKNTLTIAEKGTVKSSLKQTQNHTINEEYSQQIILNRPFAYLIINNETNDIMFIGKVVRVNEST